MTILVSFFHYTDQLGRLHLRPAVRDSRSVWPDLTDLAQPPIHKHSNDRTDFTGSHLRRGAHRQPPGGNAFRRSCALQQSGERHLVDFKYTQFKNCRKFPLLIYICFRQQGNSSSGAAGGAVVASNPPSPMNPNSPQDATMPQPQSNGTLMNLAGGIPDN